MMTKWASILVSHSLRNYKEKIFLQFPKIIIDGASSELMGLFVKVLKWMESIERTMKMVPSCLGSCSPGADMFIPAACLVLTLQN